MVAKKPQIPEMGGLRARARARGAAAFAAEKAGPLVKECVERKRAVAAYWSWRKPGA